MSFSCRDVHARWPEYLYRELDEPEQGRFVQHLQSCLRCRGEESQWRDLLSRFDIMTVSDGNTEPPRELVFRVKRQVQLHEEWSHQISAQFRNWLVACVAACVFFFGGIQMLHHQLSTLRNPDTIFRPFTNSVLNALYSQDELRVLSDEGMFARENLQKSQIAADLPVNSDSGSDTKGNAATPASQKESRGHRHEKDT
jgi:hypothetical protein